MCAVLLPLGVNPIAVNKYINQYQYSHITITVVSVTKYVVSSPSKEQ